MSCECLLFFCSLYSGLPSPHLISTAVLLWISQQWKRFEMKKELFGMLLVQYLGNFFNIVLIDFGLILLVWVLVTWKECTYCINWFICIWNVKRHISKKHMLHNKLVYHPYHFLVSLLVTWLGGVLFCPFSTRIVNAILYT